MKTVYSILSKRCNCPECGQCEVYVVETWYPYCSNGKGDINNYYVTFGNLKDPKSREYIKAVSVGNTVYNNEETVVENILNMEKKK